jgi:glycosyltransferase involved in cell wall biosynthesis
MKVAIDLTPLQGPHRMRGIGATVINFINNISEDDKAKNEFVFYIHGDKESPLELLNLKGLNYRTVKALSRPPQKTSRLPWKLGWPIRALKQASKLTDFYFGDDRLKKIGKVDAFLQFEQDKPLPRGRTKKTIVLYDLIQYILETDYLIGYKTARMKGFSRKSSFNHYMHRWIYIHKLRVNVKRADKLLAISTQTKDDFLKHAHASKKKISVVPLGVNELDSPSNKPVAHHHYYIASSWGYLKKPYKLEPPYLLFVGGADPRRKIVDLVTAFNHLRAQGNRLKLVLVGDILQGPENIPIVETRRALETSSYKEDIIYMGFVSDEQKNDLYENALAFVYPSIYEGFGLPVLEALNAGCPTICYDIPPIREVAGSTPLYANGYQDIIKFSVNLLDGNNPRIKQTAYIWEETTRTIFNELENL